MASGNSSHMKVEFLISVKTIATFPVGGGISGCNLLNEVSSKAFFLDNKSFLLILNLFVCVAPFSRLIHTTVTLSVHP